MDYTKILDGIATFAYVRATNGDFTSMNRAIEEYETLKAKHDETLKVITKERNDNEFLAKAYRENQSMRNEYLHATRLIRDLLGWSLQDAINFISNGEEFVLTSDELNKIQPELLKLGYKITFA